MRQQYIFDGINGGTLSVTESPRGGSLLVCFAVEGSTLEVEVSADDFRALADLRFRLNLDRSAELPQLRAA